MAICLERGADLHMAQLMPLPLTVFFFCKIQIGLTFLVLAHPGSPGQRAVKRLCVCVCVFSLWLVIFNLFLCANQNSAPGCLSSGSRNIWHFCSQSVVS